MGGGSRCERVRLLAEAGGWWRAYVNGYKVVEGGANVCLRLR
mgnify:CR=1 FL=1